MLALNSRHFEFSQENGLKKLFNKLPLATLPPFCEGKFLQEKIGARILCLLFL
jgi:hypothetical protein